MRQLSLTLALGIALTLGACSSPSQAPATKPDAMTAEQRLEAAKALVSNASQGKITAYEVSDGPDGLYKLKVGPENTDESQRAIVWMSPNAEVFLPGPAIDKTGKNLSAETPAPVPATTSAPQDSSFQAELLTRAISNPSASFIQGTKGPIVTAIVDLNCSHCNDFFAAAQPLIDKGELRVRYLLAGFLTPTSEMKAARVLEAKDRVAALKAAEAGYRKSGAGDDSQVISKDMRGQVAWVKANTQLLLDTKKPSTPYLFHCDKETKQVVGDAGYPQDLAGFVKTIGEEGHPACSK